MSLSPRGSSDSLDRPDPNEASLSDGNLQYKNWKNQRNTEFHAGIAHLRKDLLRAQAAAQEANCLSKEMDKGTEFIVSLQIPAHNLTPNRKSGTLLCEPAIRVINKGQDCQIWTVEKLENRLADMREAYMDFKDNGAEKEVADYDPFVEKERNQLLIGVANVFLSCLLQNHPFRYPVPIIDQHGQVAGKLVVEVHRLSDMMHCELMKNSAFDACHDDSSMSDISSSGSSGIGSSMSTDVLSTNATGTPLSPDVNEDSAANLSSCSTPADSSQHSNRNNQMTCRVTVVEAQGLSPALSHFVQCQYMFLDCPDTILVPPDLRPDELSPKSR